MAFWTNLKSTVASVIKTNGNREITGAILQSTLHSIIEQVGANATFKGEALPATNPSTPDGPVFYLAVRAGTYSNFTGETLKSGVHIFTYNDGWARSSILIDNPNPDLFQGGTFKSDSYASWALLFNDIDSEIVDPDLIVTGWYEIVNIGYHTSSGHDGISIQFVEPDGTRSVGMNGYDSDDNGIIVIPDTVRGLNITFTIDTDNYPSTWETVPNGVLKLSSNNIFSKGSKHLVVDVDTAIATANTAQSTADDAAAAAAAAQSTADGAVSAAAAAQSTANDAETDAAAAQSTADGAQTAANTAQSTADSAASAAAAAQSTADDAETDAVAAQATADNHISNGNVHVTPENKTTWDGKADTSYVDQAEADAISTAAADATTKANAAEADANTYTDTEIAGLNTVYEPKNTNIQTHISNGNVHVTPENKTTWDGKADVLAVTREESTSFTVDDTDNGNYIRYTGASNFNLDIDNSLAIGTIISIRQAGDGIITFTPGSGTPTLNGDATTNGLYSLTQVIKVSDGVFDIITFTITGGGTGDIYIADIIDWPAQGFSLSNHEHDETYEPANTNIQTHISNGNVHVTPENKTTWDGKADTSYVDQAEADANTYTDTEIAGLNTVYEPKNTNIQTHISDGNVHVTPENKTTWDGKADTSYVDQAEADAISTAAADATTKANAAEADAVSTAAADATTKANAAEANANGYTDTEIAGLNTVYEPKNTNIQTHISDGNVHVTPENKTTWDGKADAYAVTREESTSFTIDDADNGDYIRYTGASNFNLDIDNTLTVGSIISIRQANSGVITFVPGSGTPTLNGDTTTNGLHSLTQIIKVADGVFDIVTINDTLSDSSLGVENITFTQSIPFDKQLSIINVTQDADYEFIPNITGAVEGYRTRATITGDSSHSVTFTDFVKSGGSLDYDNTKTNSIIFWKEGDIYFYRIYEQVEYTGGSGAPAISDTNRIFPGAVGFGTDDKGAYEGSSTPTILICDSLANTETQTGTDRGTFRWCVAQAYPRIILFEVSGVIDCTDVNWRIKVENPYMNIYGQTAPGKGITLKGIVFWIETSHILIQHMRILPGDESSLIPGSDVDALDIYGAQTDVVIDHCTLGWSVDECSSPDATASNITYSNCLFKEPFDQSTHYDEHSSSVWAERHPYCSLGQAENITYYRNCFCYSYGRNPLINGNHAQIINNYVYATRWAPPMVGANNMHVDIVGNVIETFEQTGWSTHVHAVYVLDGLDASTLLYVDDNICDNAGATDWDNVYNNSNVTQSMTELNSSSGFNILPASQVKASILANCGAFYWNRDATDAEVIAKIQNDTGAPMRNSADNYPATARNMEGTATTGDMSSGHDWSSGNQTLVLSYNETPGGGIVGPYTYTLTANCADIDAVIAHINNVLPSAFLVCERIGGNTPIPTDNVCIRTTHAANSSFIEVHSSGTGHETLGIAAGTFYGQTNTPWDTSSDTDSLSVPANPHNDDDSNTYTNIEEWVYEMGYPGGESEAVAEKWLGSLAAMNVWKGTAAEYTALGTYDDNTMYLIEEV
jgi:hypothetical protein